MVDGVNKANTNKVKKLPNNEYDNGSLNYYEWIPWEHLSNINEIAKGGFGTIYKATLIDGLINTYTIKHHGLMEYERCKEGMEVVIKIMNTNSEEIFNEKLDLGLCQSVNNEIVAAEKNIYGVIPYVPPEVLGGGKFTTAGDIYSFAMLLWELATGNRPFHDRNHDRDLIFEIVFNGIKPKITSPLIPLCIAEIIVKCWDVNPENRPTAKKVLSKLVRLEILYNHKTTTESLEFLETDKYVKEMVENELTAIPSTTSTPIHSGAVYTSRNLSTSAKIVELVRMFMNLHRERVWMEKKSLIEDENAGIINPVKGFR
ncbi:hypothetical protein G9A89_023494 [Geosiphon pyriformis]|nr:hypothetical protein G9A89_023494 [Geosiphon pyriformis]